MGQITRNELAPVLTAELDTFDTTGENTSLDTKNVNGVPATTITQKITQAETDITALKEVDTAITGKISQAETTLATKADVSTFNAHVGDNTKHLTERLFPYCKSITDWNDAKENGFYMGENVANAPTAEWFIGQVTAHSSAWFEQRIVAFTSNPRHEYIRFFSNSVWSGWQRTTPGDLNALQFGSKTDIATSLNELFQYADNGKTLVRNAVIGKGVSVVASPTFQQLALAVQNIDTVKFASGSASYNNNDGDYIVTGLGFTPDVVIYEIRNTSGTVYNRNGILTKGFSLFEHQRIANAYLSGSGGAANPTTDWIIRISTNSFTIPKAGLSSANSVHWRAFKLVGVAL